MLLKKRKATNEYKKREEEKLYIFKV